MTRFFAQPCAPYRDFQIVMTAITLNFAIPSLTYAIAPQIASGSLSMIADLLGGPPFPAAIEDASLLWRMLAASNVMTLALMCFLLQYSLRRYIAVLVPLVFLKLTSATMFLVVTLTAGQREFATITLLDGGTAALFTWLTLRAHRAIAEVPDDLLVPRPR